MRYLSILCVALIAGASLSGQESNPHSILSGGGGTMNSTEHSVRGSLSQTAIGHVSMADRAADLGFWYVATRERSVDSASVIIALPNMDAETGQTIDVAIMQQEADWPNDVPPSEVELDITFNGSVLQPVEPFATCPPSGLCTVTVKAQPRDVSGMIGTARFQVKLGDAVASPLQITAVRWPEDVRVRTVATSGSVTVTDLCIDGDSVRLILAGDRTILRPPKPNPVQSQVNVSYRLVANSEIQLQVVDLSGTILLTLDSGLRDFGEHEVTGDVSTMAAGRYFLVLRTDDGVFYQPFMVMR